MKFNELKLIDPILDTLKHLKYETPTPIQEQSIPLLLEGYDVIGIAQTGTGKTAAFVIPILQKLTEHKGYGKDGTPRALILAPTRELAAQISDSVKTYGKLLNLEHLSIYGGVKIQPQIKGLRRGVDILIATPGRLIDLMNQGEIDFRQIEFLVLDEADRMLDMGFVKDIKKIVSSLPVNKQSLFFSATMSKQITDLTNDFLKNPKRVEVTPEATPIGKIEQCVFFVDNEKKNELLLELIFEQKITKAIIFVGMKFKADRVVRMLRANGISSDAIHGNKSQFQRTRAIKDFASGKVSILVATDIAARGIDIKDISHVINYDLPNEPENYVHRIGRTARAGANGTAYSFCCATDRNFLNQIERVIKKKLEQAAHKNHSVKAKSAEGSDARPAPRKGKSFSKVRKNTAQNKESKKEKRRDTRRRRGDSKGNKGRKMTKGNSRKRVSITKGWKGRNRKGR